MGMCSGQRPPGRPPQPPCHPHRFVTPHREAKGSNSNRFSWIPRHQSYVFGCCSLLVVSKTFCLVLAHVLLTVDSFADGMEV